MTPTTQQDKLQRQAIAGALRDANPCDGGSNCQCEPGTYYVSAVDGPKWFLMAGPYPTHRAAQADRAKALHIADQYDGRAWFMSWGTVRMLDGTDKPGVLNRAGLMGGNND